MSSKITLNKTEESVYTLLSLFVLIQQAFESLVGEEDILNSDFDVDNDSFHNLVTDTIHEALVYQILLKTCAFMDEWNKNFGVHTDAKDRDTIMLVKKITKPAAKYISAWKQLRDFRNEAIAHNHRDKNGNNIYLTGKVYHMPESTAELYLVVYSLKKMAEVTSVLFDGIAQKSVSFLELKLSTRDRKNKGITKRDFQRTKKEIGESIDTDIYNHIMGREMLNSLSNRLSN